MSETVNAGSVDSNGSKPMQMRDLESYGMVSVYIDGKFVWQLPKKLLCERVPAAKLDTPDSTDSIDSLTTWEITDCTRDAFRVFNEWLYSPGGRLKKGPSADIPLEAYLDASKFASRYEIHNLLHDVMGIVLDALKCSAGNDLTSVGDAYKHMTPKSPEGGTVSGHFAALFHGNKLDAQTSQALLKSPELARDILAWLFLYKKHNVDQYDYNKVLVWTNENISQWVDQE